MSDIDGASVRETQLRLEKLQLEVEQLRHRGRWDQTAGRVLPVVSALIPVLALLFAVQQFVSQQRSATAALDRQTRADAASSERTFMQPVLSRMMNTYFDASAAAATVASSQDAAARARARDTFLQLYWGPLVMMESPAVSGAMKAFKECMDDAACPPGELTTRSLALSSTLQNDLFSAWRLSPDEYAQRSIDYAAGQLGTAP